MREVVKVMGLLDPEVMAKLKQLLDRAEVMLNKVDAIYDAVVVKK